MSLLSFAGVTGAYARRRVVHPSDVQGSFQLGQWSLSALVRLRLSRTQLDPDALSGARRSETLREQWYLAETVELGPEGSFVVGHPWVGTTLVDPTGARSGLRRSSPGSDSAMTARTCWSGAKAAGPIS